MSNVFLQWQTLQYLELWVQNLLTCNKIGASNDNTKDNLILAKMVELLGTHIMLTNSCTQAAYGHVRIPTSRGEYIITYWERKG